MAVQKQKKQFNKEDHKIKIYDHNKQTTSFCAIRFVFK